MDFDKIKTEEYADQAKRRWGTTDAYREYAEKSRGRSPQEEDALRQGLTAIFAEFGRLRADDPASPQAQALVKRLQAYITEHYYHCTPEILKGLGSLYAAGGDFTQNIDRVGGAGTAEFAERAIAVFCG